MIILHEQLTLKLEQWIQTEQYVHNSNTVKPNVSVPLYFAIFTK